MAGILIIDANQVIRKLFYMGLQGFGFQLAEVESYQQAISYLESGDIPSVVIVDYQRNHEPARQFISYLQQTPDYQHIRIIVTTVNSLTEDEQNELGVDAVMEKPVDLSRLVKAVYLYHRPDN